MKRLLLLFLMSSFSISFTFAQNIISSRVAVLERGGYDVTGKAYLELYDDNTLHLRLDEDFKTMTGPSLGLFLSPQAGSVTNAINIRTLGDANSGIIKENGFYLGEYITPVPNNISIDSFSHVVIWCIPFGAHWSSGAFDESVSTLPTYECVNTLTATTGWETDVTICKNDGSENSIPLLNNQFIEAGDHYAYILTNDYNKIDTILTIDSYDFNNASFDTTLVYGLSYNGEIEYTKNGSLSSIQTTGCMQLSDTNSLHLEVINSCLINNLTRNSGLQDISIYPNPASSNLIFFDHQLHNIQITNTSGETIIQKESALKINISNLENGIYFIHSEEGYFRFIVNK